VAGRNGTQGLRRLTKRSEFLRAARGNRAGRSGFSLQSIEVADEAPGIGFTVSKKVGNAPQRNRVKRRLRAAVGACADRFHPRHDYVLVGRTDALTMPFGELVRDLAGLIDRVGAKSPPRPQADSRNQGR
jgi:ribonuclease P protein component